MVAPIEIRGFRYWPGLLDTPAQEALVADLRRLTTNLTRLSEQLNRQPTRLLFGDRREGYSPP